MTDNELFGNSEQLDCSDCVNHGGDWECDHIHCRKSMDTISRAAAIDALGERPMPWTDDDYYVLGGQNQYDSDRLAIETVPSAQRWIPCSERLPKVRDWVLCQCRAGIMDVFRLTEDGSWNKNYPHAEYMGGFVIAWMPLPAPYRPEGDEKHGTPRSV